MKQILASYDPKKKIYLFGQDLNEYSDCQVILLEEDPLKKNFDNSNLEKNSVLIIEDFIPGGKNETGNLHFLLNYFSRHNKIEIFIVVHQLFFSQLSFFLSTAQEIYISVANSNLILTKKLDKLYSLNITQLLKKALNNQETYNFIGLFHCSNYIYPFNHLFLKEASRKIMFFNNNKTYYLLDSEKFDFKKEKVDDSSETPSEKLESLIKSVYPKKSGNILLLANELYAKLESLKVIDEAFIITLKKKKICHLMDLISAIQSPGKNYKISRNILVVLKFLQKNRLVVMSKLVVNKTAKKYLCIGTNEKTSESDESD